MLEKISNLKLSLVNTCLLSASTLTLGVLLPSSLLTLPAVAVKLSNGQVAFNHPPSLIRVATSSSSPNTSATYYFTLSVPKDAGELLEAVKIVQRQNVDTVAFDMNQSRAYKGNSVAGGPALSLASIGGEAPANPGEAVVVFDPPVSPGSKVTVALKAKHNPWQGGVYLFGVTAYPAGENGIGQFLGYGRIHFHRQ